MPSPEAIVLVGYEFVFINGTSFKLGAWLRWDSNELSNPPNPNSILLLLTCDGKDNGLVSFIFSFVHVLCSFIQHLEAITIYFS